MVLELIGSVCVCVCVCVCVSMFIYIWPLLLQMVSLYRDPDGNNIFKDPASNQRAASADSGGEIATLQKKVRELEKQVTLARSNEVYT